MHIVMMNMKNLIRSYLIGEKWINTMKTEINLSIYQVKSNWFKMNIQNEIKK